MRLLILRQSPHNAKVVEQIILNKFLLNLTGCCEILLTRNFAAEIIEIGRRRELLVHIHMVFNYID